MADSDWRRAALALRSGAVTPEAFVEAIPDVRLRVALMRALLVGTGPSVAYGLLDGMGEETWGPFTSAIDVLRTDRNAPVAYLLRRDARRALGVVTPGSCVDQEKWGEWNVACPTCDYDPKNVDGPDAMRLRADGLLAHQCPCFCATCIRASESRALEVPDAR